MKYWGEIPDQTKLPMIEFCSLDKTNETPSAIFCAYGPPTSLPQSYWQVFNRK